MEIVQSKELYFAYSGEEKEVLQGVNLSLEEGKFYILCGESGCGKSTLLRHMKSALMPKGRQRGSLWKGVKEEEIGFVFQHPDNQIVTDKVWHELVFGMENLGIRQESMHLRVAELAAYFGVEHWFDREVSQLSGGQKQLLNLAAVLTLRPKLLLLDEPMAWLDPMAASEFLHTLYRIQREMGMTVLLSAHQLEEVISYGDELLFMEEGRIVIQGSPEQIGKELRDRGAAFYHAMPVPMRIYFQSGSEGDCPCTIAQGREWLGRELQRRRDFDRRALTQQEEVICPMQQEDAGGEGDASDCRLRIDNLWFRYPDADRDVLCGTSFQVQRGEILGILGGNGSGKSTLLRVVCGLLPKGAGKLLIWKKEKWEPLEKGAAAGTLALLPQDVSSIFLEETLERELSAPGLERERDRWVERFRLKPLLKRHPYDISGGEQQKAAIVKLLLRSSDIFLLDEPTRGMDAGDRLRLGECLQELADSGKTIIMVSHDLEFTARFAHRAGLFFRGRLEGLLPARDFFCQNYFYTTAAHRMSRESIPDAVTVEDVLAVLEGEAVEKSNSQPQSSITKNIPRGEQLQSDISSKVCVSGPSEMGQRSQPWGLKGRELPLYILGIFLLYPALLWLGESYFEERRYLLISLGMVAYALLPFFRLWEKRPPRVQKLVVVSVLAAIAVAGRCAFYMLPGMKPMAAVAIVTGVSLGAESGFFVGAMSMLVSNMMFGQGPWTPWQMLAMGLVGLFAGLLMNYRSFMEAGSWLQRIAMGVYGLLGVLCIYGGIMNPASLLMAAYELNLQNLTAIYLSGLPADLVHGGTTAALLFAAGLPMLKKLERMKKKYELE